MKMRSAAIIAALALASTINPCLAQAAPAAAPGPSSEALLSQAHALAGNFIPEERAKLLIELSLADAGNPPHARASARESFRVAQTLPVGHNRAALEKNALMALAAVDPAGAAALYREQDEPKVWGPFWNEDLRAFGARTLFPLLWGKQGMAALATIEPLAQYLGATGAYPYHAMAGIVNKVAESDAGRARELFAEVIPYLARDPGYRNSGTEFTYFLLLTHAVASDALVRQAITADLDWITADQRKEDQPKYVARVTSKQGSAQFNSRDDLVLYQLLPLVRTLDPSWADSLERQNTALRAAPALALGAPATVSAAVAEDSAAPPNPASFGQALDQGWLQQVGQQAPSDPAAATAIADHIASPDLRAQALAKIAPYRRDAGEASDDLKQAATEVQTLPDGIPKLDLMITLAEAEYRSKRAADGWKWTEQALDLGTGLFDQEMEAKPDTLSYLAAGSDEMVGLVTAVASLAPSPLPLESRLRQVQDTRLRARLLIAAASGLRSAPPPA